MPPDNTPAPLVYNGEVISARAEMLSLTDMWRAAGSDPARQPSNWLASADAKRFIETLDMLEPRNSGVQTKRGGRGVGGSTFAHWQIGLAYAKYLSPEFHMWCNTVVRERMEGRPQGVARLDLDAEVRRTIGGIMKSVVHRELTEIVPEMVRSELSAGLLSIRRGKTAGQIWKDHGFPPVKNGSAWLGNRLSEVGCRIADNGYGELGLIKARLFDPDKADSWLRNGGKLLVDMKITERRGQGRLRLIQPTA